jgi:hypothetical protein
MTIRTLPLEASDDDIKALVVEWSELLAQKRFAEALAMFHAAERGTPWTPETLEKVIAGYGVLDPDPPTIEFMLQEHETSRFEITTLLGRADRDEIIREKIDVDREHLFGLDPKRYLGMVHYHDVPLSGHRSDLTARFHIRRVGTDRLTLEFLDIHVM